MFFLECLDNASDVEESDIERQISNITGSTVE